MIDNELAPGGLPTCQPATLTLTQTWSPPDFPEIYGWDFLLSDGSTLTYTSSSNVLPPINVCHRVDLISLEGEWLAWVSAAVTAVAAERTALRAAYNAAGLSPALFENLAAALDPTQSACDPRVITGCIPLPCDPCPLPADSSDRAYHTATLHIKGDVTQDGVWTWYEPNDADPNYYYLPIQAKGIGHGSYWWDLRTGRVGTSFRPTSTNTIVDWSPDSDINGSGTCGSLTYSISGYGISLSRTMATCKNKISVNLYTPNDYFRAQWNGAAYKCRPGEVAYQFGKKPENSTDEIMMYLYTYQTGAEVVGLTC